MTTIELREGISGGRLAGDPSLSRATIRHLEGVSMVAIGQIKNGS